MCKGQTGCLRSLTAWNGCGSRNNKILLRIAKQNPICHCSIYGKKLPSPSAAPPVATSSLYYALIVIMTKELKADYNKSDLTSFFPVRLYPVLS